MFSLQCRVFTAFHTTDNSLFWINQMFILARKYGRLCNRLFNTAHILALAIENDQTFVNLSFYDYAEHFPATQNDILCRYPVQKGFLKKNKAVSGILYNLSYNFAYFLYYLSRLGVKGTWLGLSIVRPVKKKHNHLIADVELTALPLDFAKKPQAVFFQGWNLRCSGLVQKHANKIREYFKPADSYQSKVGDFVKEHRKGNDLLVGVVVRHGDYRLYLGGKYFYQREAYLSWMEQMQGLFPGEKIKFLIFSDEEQDTELFKQAGIDFFFRSGHMIENLYSLAECDYIITAPSTYGLWASFYGKTPYVFLTDANQLISSTDCFSICEG
jgi:hypothetical protein